MELKIKTKIAAYNAGYHCALTMSLPVHIDSTIEPLFGIPANMIPRPLVMSWIRGFLVGRLEKITD